MKYLSVCSGIEAATVAWAPLGWKAVAFCEIEPFPCAVLEHRLPGVPNLGNLLNYLDWPEEVLAEVDILAGGTPCQAFSFAGLRASLADDRGNLTLVYALLIDHIDAIRARYGRPPVICIWENVPGVLSTRDNAFGCFLASLAGESVPLVAPGGKWTDTGYVRGPARAIAWRSFDAQYFGLAQRRERVFVVAGAGDIRPEEVLFECEGVRRDSPPRREKGERVAGTLTTSSLDGSSPCGGDGRESFLISETVPCLDASYGKLQGCSGQDLRHDHGHLIAIPFEVADALTSNPYADRGEDNNLVIQEVTHALTGEGFDASEDGTGRGTPIIPVAIAFDCKASGQNGFGVGDVAPTLRSMGHAGSHQNGGGHVAVCFDTTQITSATNGSNPQPGDPCHTLSGQGHAPAIAFAIQAGALRENPESGPDGIGVQEGLAYTIEARAEVQAIAAVSYQTTTTTWAVRRLTPRECERLQGFPDDYTLIPWGGKPADLCPDGHRYKALGNSWAVPCARWIGMRLQTHLFQIAA